MEDSRAHCWRSSMYQEFLSLQAFLCSGWEWRWGRLVADRAGVTGSKAQNDPLWAPQVGGCVDLDLRSRVGLTSVAGRLQTSSHNDQLDFDSTCLIPPFVPF